MDTAEHQQLRHDMVVQQLRSRDIVDLTVQKVMESVPRHLFIPESNRPYAYEDRPVPIGYGQTISQPYIVALMTQILEIQGGQKILEIGTGSGYQAAILEQMGAQVYTIEIIPELAQFARNNLKELGYTKIKVKTGDGYQGWLENAPFDAIIVTCAPEAIPKPLLEQLKENGKMIIPIGPENQIQELLLVEKRKGHIQRKSIAPVRFVPMVGEAQK